MNKGIDMIFSKEYCNCALAIAFVWQVCYRLKLNTPHTVQDFRLLKGYPLKEDWICWQMLTERLHFEHFTILGECSIFSRHTASWRKACLKEDHSLWTKKSLSLNLKCSFKKIGIFHVCVCLLNTAIFRQEVCLHKKKGRIVWKEGCISSK